MGDLRRRRRKSMQGFEIQHHVDLVGRPMHEEDAHGAGAAQDLLGRLFADCEIRVGPEHEQGVVAGRPALV